MTCVLTFHNRHDASVDARLFLPVPVTRPPALEVLSVALPQGARELPPDASGNRRVRIDVRNVAAGGEARVEMQVRVRTHQVVSDVDARLSGSGPCTDPPLAPFLKEEPDLPVGDAAVRRAAADLTQGAGNRWDGLVRLYDFVRGLRFEMAAGPRDVREVLRTRVAQCADAAALLVTLARASGLPARRVGGVFLPDEASSTAELHDWAEVWVSPFEWVSVDPTMGRFDDMTRASRLAAQMLGYVALWSGPDRVFSVETSPPAPQPEAADLSVSFRWTPPRVTRASSLLARFPVPRARASARAGSGDETARRAEASVALAQAQDLAHARQTGRALAALQRAIDTVPADPVAWNTVINTYAALEIWDGVALAAERAGALMPGQVDFPRAVAQACMRQGNYPRARDAFQEALALTPGDGWMHAMRGWALRECGDRDGARAEITTGLRLGIDGSERSFFEKMRDALGPSPLP